MQENETLKVQKSNTNDPTWSSEVLMPLAKLSGVALIAGILIWFLDLDEVLKEWSERTILSLAIVITFCLSIFKTLKDESMRILKDVTLIVIGFYFDASNPQQPTSPTAFKASKVSIEPSALKIGEKLKIAVQTQGGKPPFDYTISFKPENIIGERKVTVLKKTFTEDKVIPPGVTAGTTVETIISIKDKTGASAEIPTLNRSINITQ